MQVLEYSYKVIFGLKKVSHKYGMEYVNYLLTIILVFGLGFVLPIIVARLLMNTVNYLYNHESYNGTHIDVSSLQVNSTTEALFRSMSIM